MIRYAAVTAKGAPTDWTQARIHALDVNGRTLTTVCGLPVRGGWGPHIRFTPNGPRACPTCTRKTKKTA